MSDAAPRHHEQKQKPVLKLLLIASFVLTCLLGLLTWFNLNKYKDTHIVVQEFKALGGECSTYKVVPAWINKLNLRRQFAPNRFLQLDTLVCKSDEQLEYVIDNVNIRHVKALRLHSDQITGERLSQLGSMPKLIKISTTHLDADISRGLIPASRFPAIRRLNLRGIAIDDKALEGFSKLSNPWELALGGMQLSDKCIETLSQLHSLQKLSIFSRALTNDNLEQISKLKQLTKLEVSGKEITDEGIVHLSQLTNLTDLKLTCGPISDAGWKSVEKLKNLRVVEIRGARASDQALLHFNKLTRLKHLSLPDSRISGKGLTELANHEQLTTLKLGRSIIEGNDLKLSPLLQTLTLNNSEFSSSGIDQIGKLQNLTFFRSYDSTFNGPALQQFLNIPNLTHLDLHGSTIKDCTINTIPENASLEHLRCDGVPIPLSSFQKLQNLPALYYLNIGGPWITTEHLRNISAFSNLGCLFISDCSINSPVLSQLKYNTKLDWIYFTDIHFTNEACQAIPPLKGLHFKYTRLSEESLLPLQQMTARCEVIIDNESISDEFLEELKNSNSNLKIRRIDSN